MAYELSSLKKMDDFSYYKEVKALLNFLQTNWDISAAPKGLDKFLKGYTDYQGMEEINEKALLKSFNGHGDGTAGSDCLVVKLTLEHVAYSVKNQANGALEVLIQALLTHGIVLGQRLANIDRKGEAYRRIEEIQHAFIMADSPHDPELGMIYKKELKDLLNINNKLSYDEIYEEKEKKLRELERERFLPVLSRIMKRKSSVVVYQSETPDIRATWGYIHTQTGSDSRYKAFVEDLKQQGVSIKKDGNGYILSKIKGAK